MKTKGTTMPNRTIVPISAELDRYYKAAANVATIADVTEGWDVTDETQARVAAGAMADALKEFRVASMELGL